MLPEETNARVQRRRLTMEVLNEADLRRVMYVEVTAPGGMGNLGGVVMEVFDGNVLSRYESNIELDEAVWDAASQKVKSNRDLFDYHYGGYGNDVFLKRGAGIVADEQNESLTFEHDGKPFHFRSSVLGVFRAVAASMRASAKA
jgi:hypothetical protein